MSNLTAFPLCWPAGWPRTDVLRRETGNFKADLPRALKSLQDEIRRMGGTEVLLSSNCALGDERPKDCGVVAYFNWKPSFDAAPVPMAIPCDRWNRVADNVRAIALTVEAMRGMERWGAKHMIKAMFTGFKMLPEAAGGLPWWQVLGVKAEAGAEQIRQAYRDRAKAVHPDKGGSTEAMAALNAAFDQAMKRQAA